jgi:transcriptional regulator with XRE-family HTH domain
MTTKHGHFGNYLKSLLAAKRITLREFCRRAEADPGNISRMERGLIPPPQDEHILKRYAGAAEVRYGSDEWYRFVDLAAADRGIVPRDLLSDKEVVKILPVLFRTMRRDRPDEEQLNRLVDKLRRV